MASLALPLPSTLITRRDSLPRLFDTPWVMFKLIFYQDNQYVNSPNYHLCFSIRRYCF